jgi:hypothetical protein
MVWIFTQRFQEFMVRISSKLSADTNATLTYNAPTIYHRLEEYHCD